jgi:hypothetical protein
MAAALLLFVSAAVSLCFWHSIAHVWATWLALGLSAATFALIRSRRRTPPVWLGCAAFLLVVLAALNACWLAGEDLRYLGYTDAGPDLFRLGALSAALVSPPVFSVAIAAVLGFFGGAVAWILVFPQWYVADVYMLILYALFTVLLLAFRQRSFSEQRAAMRARIEAEALRRLAVERLAVRDLMNTPLQTLDFLTTLLRAQSPEGAALLDRMERSVARLRECSRALGSRQEALDWNRGEESFDALDVLAEKQNPTPPSPRTQV